MGKEPMYDKQGYKINKKIFFGLFYQSSIWVSSAVLCPVKTEYPPYHSVPLIQYPED